MKVTKLVLIVVIVLWTTGVFADIWQDIKQDSVIVTTIRTGNMSRGSGFVFKTNVVTCAHVVGTNKYCFIEYSNGNSEAGTVIRRDDDADVVLIAVTNYPKASRKRLGKYPKLGDEVYSCSSPPMTPFQVTKGNVVSIDQIDTKDRIVFTSDMHGWYGSSGSAVYNKYGHIIGITHEMFTGGKIMLHMPASVLKKWE